MKKNLKFICVTIALTGIQVSLFADITSETLSILTTPDMLETSVSESLDFAKTPKAPSFKIQFDTIVKSNSSGYTLKQVTDIALRNNAQFSVYEANRLMAQAELIKALEYPNPQVEVSMGKAKSIEGDGSRSVHSIALSQPIELPGKRKARQLEAEYGIRYVEYEANEYRALLQSDVEETYYTILYYTALERHSEAVQALSKNIFTIAEKKVDLGDSGKFELLNSKMELLQAEYDLKKVKSQKRAAELALNKLTGSALSDNFKLSGSIIDKKYSSSITMKQFVENSLRNHPKLLKLAAELESKNSSIQRQRKEWWPDLNLGVQTAKDFDTKSNAVTLGVEVPLWNRNNSGITRAIGDAHKTYAEIVVACNELRNDVLSAWNNLELAKERVLFYKDETLKTAEELVNISYLQYNLGAVSQFEILTARTTFKNVQKNYLEALYDLQIAHARLIKAGGFSPNYDFNNNRSKNNSGIKK